MKPLPTQDLPEEEPTKPISDDPSKQEATTEPAKSVPALPLKQQPTNYSKTNRRVNGCPVQRVYPWLLFASTAVAATFCLAYITKPVILAAPSPASNSQDAADFVVQGKSENTSLDNLPLDETGLPGDGGLTPDNSLPASLLASDFEETNIRIQHVIDAVSPSGDVSRLTIDVPVLYHSRTLRWSQEETEQARDLLARLAAYQDQIRALRNEGTQLLNEWNGLTAISIPGDALRADSPSLPANQKTSFAPKGADVSDTVETIKLQKPAK